LIVLLQSSGSARAQTADHSNPRSQIMLTGPGWQVTTAGDKDTLPEVDTPGFRDAVWQPVSLPHTFQTRTDFDTPTQGWYRRNLTAPAGLAGKRLYVVFEGVTSVAEVFVNGRRLGEHRGAYTRFLFDITGAVHPGDDNELAVKVDNRAAQIHDLLPNHTRLFKLWGGVNRKVWLLETPAEGIDPTDFAAPGVYITPSEVSGRSAHLSVRALLRNTDGTPRRMTARATLLDPSDKVAAVFTADPVTVAGSRVEVTMEGRVVRPRLWDLLAPQLYHVRVDVLEGRTIVDSVTEPTGFRTVDFHWKDGETIVNGRRVKLLGVNQHAEIEGKTNAVSDEDLIAGFDNFTDLGVNFVRLPHYPHAQLEYDQCDARGILCWPEDGHTNDEPYGPAAIQIVTEMVKQNYNHPSLPLWSVGNEAKAEAAEMAVPLVRALDPTRPVVAANMKCDACDERTANKYPGWYQGGFRDYEVRGFISEIGAGGGVGTHTDYNKADYQVDVYEPEEYQQLVAEDLFAKVFDPSNDKLGMFLWWCMRDFSDTKYRKPEGMNTKGLMTYAGDKKDVYFLYRSFLRPSEPTVHLTSQRYFLRRGAANDGIKAYSNAKALTLTLNGKTVSTLPNGKYTQPDGPYLLHPGTKAGFPAPRVPNVFFWPVPLRSGKNTVSVGDGHGHTDTAVVYFYGTGGAPEMPVERPLIASLASSNAANPAFFMDMPVHAQWPIYTDLDSTADNSWNLIPHDVEGARWIALHRVTKKDQATSVTLTLTRPATLYVVASLHSDDEFTGKQIPESLKASGVAFVPNGPFRWRDNALMLVPAGLYQRQVKAGEAVTIQLGDTDAAILLKE
jgi:beta-galactosidase